MNESLSRSPGFKFLYLSTKMGRFISILSNLLFIFLNLLGLPLQFIYQVVFYDWQRCCGIMSQSLHHCNINIHKIQNSMDNTIYMTIYSSPSSEL